MPQDAVRSSVLAAGGSLLQAPARRPQQLEAGADRDAAALLTVFGVRLNVLASNNGNALYTALQENDSATFWTTIGVFAVLAAVSVAQAVIVYYVSNLQIIRWRQWTNTQVLTDWLSGTAYHRGRFIADPIDNPDQRIQDDVTSFTTTRRTWPSALIGSMVTLVSFTLILWSCPGRSTSSASTIPRAMVFIAYIYVIIATVIAFRIGRPLIRLNFLNELLTASFRYALVRLRDNSEHIAFYGGEAVEKPG